MLNVKVEDVEIGALQTRAMSQTCEGARNGPLYDEESRRLESAE